MNDSEASRAGVYAREEVIDKVIEDARAEGYAKGREDQRIAGKVPLALMSDELRMMPDVLVDAYAALCAEALSDGTEGMRGEDVRVPPRLRPWRTSSSQTEVRGLAKAGGKKGPRGGPSIKNAKLLALKSSVDRKLRKIARQIQTDLAGGLSSPPRKCSRCGRFGEDNWNWCPWDGAAMQSEDRQYDTER